MSTTLLCALLLHTGAVAPAEPEESLVTRSFSLSDLRASAAGEYDAVCPFPFVLRDSDSVHHGDEHHVELHGPLEELIYSVVAPDEFEYEGRMLWFGDDDRMVVRAPEGVVDKVSGLVDYLRAALVRHAEIALTVRELEPADDEAGGDPRLGHVVYSERRSVRLERTLSLGAPVRHAYVRGWDTEIAQNAIIAEPAMATVLSGLELLLRVEEAGGGDYRLKHVARIADLVELDERDGGRVERVLLEGNTWLGGGQRVQLPVVGLGFATGSQVLRAGEQLAQSLWTETEAGWRGWSIEVDLVSVEPAPEPFVVEGGVVHVLPLSRHVAPGARLERPRAPWLGQHHDFGHRFDEFDEPPHVHLVEGYEFDGLAMEAFEGSWEFDPVLIGELGSALLAAGHPEGVSRGLARLPDALPPRRNVWVEVGVGSDGETLARAELALETGTDGLLMLGDVRTLFTDWEVDVAQGTAGSTPMTSDALDGLVLRVRAGDRAVRVEGLVQRLLDIESSHSGLDLPVQASASVDANVPLDGRARGVARVDGTSLWVRASLR